MRTLYKRLRLWLHGLRPTHAILVGYVFYVTVIFLPLCLPICWTADWVSPIDNLFIATSAISTTGLGSVNTADVYNFWGQLLVLIGVQIGGLGYMTLGSFAILASKGRIPKSRLNIGRAVLAMPDTFEPTRFLRHVVLFTFSIEGIGALVLWQAFTEAGAPNPLWAAIFHSVSAFCTAGFSTFSNNLESFSDNAKISMTVSVLSLLGAIGFIVLDDVYHSIKSRSVSTTLTTRIILVSTLGAVAVGTILLFFDATVAEMPLKERSLVAFFHTVSALSTAGFDTLPLAKFSSATAMVVIILMLLGASPAGTGGGLKSTTWSAALATIASYVRGREEITFWGSKVPHGRMTAAFASFALYLIAFTVGTYLLLLTDKHPFEDAAFEVASALGTVGLSRGITGDLTFWGKVVIILMMFIGRLGVVSLALAAVAFYRNGEEPELPSQGKNEDIVL